MRASIVATMLAVAVCVATPARAADDEPPCLADVNRLCNGVPPTGNFVQGCLEARADQLSPACRKRVGRYTRDAEALETACRDDVGRLCPDSPLLAGARMSCLVAHRDALSGTCRKTLDQQSRD